MTQWPPVAQRLVAIIMAVITNKIIHDNTISNNDSGNIIE